MKRKHYSIIVLRVRRKLLFIAASVSVFLFIFLAVPSSAEAVGPCQVGLTIGGDISDGNIDGNTSSGWADASVIQSGSPCLDFLKDWNGTTVSGDHAVPSLNKIVRLLSKRSATHLYLAFEIEDQTQNRQDPGNVGSPLLLGEKLVIQIDPNNSGGANLGSGSNLDYRIDLAHKWGTSSTLVTDFYDSGTAPSDSICGRQDWRLSSSLPAGLVTNFSTGFSGGYSVELKIPLSAIGSPGSDIGLAFAVINDLGYCVSNCDATGAAFPDTLPINNAASALVSDPNFFPGCSDWLTPNNWGTGYFNDPMPHVWISHVPKYWQSEDMRAFKCDSSMPDYTYHPAAPCRIEVEATIHNSGTTEQIRNLLFLWADHGASPSTWRVIDLVEGVSVPASGGTTTTRSAEFSPPTGLTHHPCIRVYILPPAFEASFDKDDILAINNASSLSAMLTAYGLAEKGAQSAQKNITRESTSDECSPESCQVAAVPGDRSPFSPWLSLMVLPLAGAAVILGRRSQSWRRLTVLLLLLSLSLTLVVAGCRGNGPQPVEEKPQEELALTDEEQKLFGDDNAMVQFEVFGFSEVKEEAGQTNYNFIESFGGVMQLIPKEIFRDDGQFELFFNISNPTELPQTMLVNPIYMAPAGTELELRYDIEPQLFLPQQELMFSNAILHLPDVTPKFPFEGAGLEGGVFQNQNDLLVMPNGDAFAYERFQDEGFVLQLQERGLIDKVFESPKDVPIVVPIP